MAHPIEIEWQFAVRDVDTVARWLAHADLGPEWRVVRATTLHLRDGYYDSADWAVARTGYALRVRAGEGGGVAMLKAFGKARGGVARRREIVERMADARLGTLRAARGAVGRRVRAATDTARLRRLFTVRTRRRVYDVHRNGRRVAELVLDRTRLMADRRVGRLERLEVEVKGSTPRVVADFVATLRRSRHLTGVRRTKFEAGLAIAGLTLPR